LSASGAQASETRLHEAYGKLPLSFEANRGQTDPQVKFLSRGPHHTLFLTSDEAVMVFTKPELSAKNTPAEVKPSKRERATQAVLRIRFVGANPKTRVQGQEELPGKANYFIGNAPTKWRTKVPTYAKVRYDDLYPGVDLIYYGTQRQLEYDVVVRPGADPNRIIFGIQGADDLEVDAQGDLVLHTAAGQIRQHKPFVYQEVDGVRKEIPGGYVLRDTHQVGFRVTAYDPSLPLIIDPLLVYSTYLGGANNDNASAVAVDAAGNAYVTGITASATNFPTTAGAFQTTLGGGSDAFVTKLNPTGTALIYSTFLGGSDFDTGVGIAVDASGNAYVTGSTASTNFPTTAGAFQTTLAGPGGGSLTDAFVTKLNPTGTALVYSTYLGGRDFDNGEEVAVDAAGNAYVTGRTSSTDFPTTVAAFQTTSAGGGDAFVTKLNSTGSALVYSTFLGGAESSDGGFGIAVDALGNAYVTGLTNSTDFPTTAGAFQTTIGSTQSAFVTKLNPTGSALVYSTYLGGSGGAEGTGIAVDAAGNAYVTGDTNSTDFPTTAGAFQTTSSGGTDAFVTKLNPAGSALVYSTFLGGSSFDQGSGIAVDASGDAYVTGRTFSTDFPTTEDGFQTTFGGARDAFVTKLNPTGSALVYSSYLGGSSLDQGSGIAVDARANAYVTGVTLSTDFPTTGDAFQTTLGGSTDAFVAKLSFANTPGGTNVTVQIGQATVTFANVTAAGDTTLATSAVGPPPPAGFKLGNPPTYYDLATTASFSGSVNVCIDYTGIAFDKEASLKLFHFEDPDWTDATLSLDTATHTICGGVTSLSPFAIFEPAIQSFAQLAASVKIERTEREFEVKGTFTLGAGSDGIHPLTEEVTLQVGTFAATIPAGSFRRHGRDKFKFKGIVGGARLEVKIERKGKRFAFEAEGKGAAVGTAKPVAVRLAVGNDAGGALAMVKVDEDD